MQKNALSAEHALLTTKLHIPQARARLVARPNLVGRLKEGATRPLVLISAPAGFGKTTLLAEWIPYSEHCVCWVSLDENDNLPVRFWSYVIAALQMLHSALGQTAQPLLDASRLRKARTSLARQPVQIEPFLTALINDLATFRDHFCLVLDDYHVIENQTIHQGLDFLLGHLPPQAHLILTSRSDPPLSLARLRARDQLVELRAGDLRFTIAEVADFLNKVMGLSLAARDVAMLEQSTEGWVAGLQLAALSLQGEEEPGQFITDFAGGDRFILEYLTEEVLRRQPKTVQSFLLKTSILDRLTGPLCDAVMGEPVAAGTEGAGFLDMLDRANLFITSLDTRRCWYRYHPLFAGLLRGHLAQTLPQEVPMLHVRASEWFEQNGLLDEAMKHALAAADTVRVARLAEAAARQVLFVRFEPLTLLAWLAALPAGLVASRPALALAEAWALVMTGQRKAATERLAVLESACAALPADARTAIQGEIAAVRATMAIPEANAPAIVKHAQLALEGLPDHDQMLRAHAFNILGIGYRYAGDAVTAERAFGDAARLSQLSGDAITFRMSTGWSANLLAEMGRLHSAAEMHRQVEQLPGVVPALGEIYIGAGAVLREWNELAEAASRIDQGLMLAQPGDLHLIVMDGLTELARIEQARHDPAEALARIDQALELGRKQNQPLHNGQLLAWRARLRLMQGDLAAALSWSEDSGLAPQDQVPYNLEDVYLTLARVLIAQARQSRRNDGLPEVIQMLDRLLQAAQSGGRMARVLEILILQALAADLQKRPAQSRAAIGRALSLAQPEGYLRAWLDEGSPLASQLERYRDFLGRAIERPEEHPANQTGQPLGIADRVTRRSLVSYVDTLLAGFQAEMTAEQGSQYVASHHMLPAGVDPLTSHELAVLRLLAAGMSAPQIAEKYILSINTIKTQTKSIYAKLGVHSRAEALAAATDLHLL